MKKLLVRCWWNRVFSKPGINLPFDVFEVLFSHSDEDRMKQILSLLFFFIFVFLYIRGVQLNLNSGPTNVFFLYYASSKIECFSLLNEVSSWKTRLMQKVFAGQMKSFSGPCVVHRLEDSFSREICRDSFSGFWSHKRP